MAKIKILVLNSGSSSIKCSLYSFSHLPDQLLEPLWETKIEWKNTQEKDPLQLEKELRPLLSNQSVDAIGHRIVHGGKKYKESVKIDENVKKEICSLASLAPLHNLFDLMGIDLLQKLFRDKPQIGVFDTSFHKTLPDYATVYPVPYKWFEEGVQRYGFHGISFQYCTRRAAEILGYLPCKMVICHLGAGASLCAVREGKSIDTTMGFTPLEGLMMDTRSGTIDPGILLYLLEKKKETLEELVFELYQRSGLLGLSGISGDMRDILEKASHNDLRAQLALDVYVHRLTSLIGSMTTSLGGLDALVFTAGIGENAPLIRKKTCNQLAFLGVHLLEPSNVCEKTEDLDLSASHSKVKILLLHTKEAFEIARECWKILHQA